MFDWSVMELIKTELDGLYGAEVMQDLRDLIRLYDIYENGIDWDAESVDYEATKKKNNKIKQLIKDEARFLFGKTPEFKLISSNKVSAAQLQTYINNVLVNNLFSSKLIKAARDCFIGKRVAIKINVSKSQGIKIMFMPSPCFVFEPVKDDVDELKKIIFFYIVKDCSDKAQQRIWRQKYELVNGKCILNEAVYNGNGYIVEEHFKNHDTGLSFIPAYVIINDGLSGDLKGESDIEDLIDSQLEYNKLSSEDIDTLRKGMNQIIYSVDINSESIENFRIKPGAFWDVDTDATHSEAGKQAVIGTISNDFGYDGRIENTLKGMKQDMHDSLKIPNVTPDELKGFITSGKSMKALYWQLIARCQEKFMDWQPAFVWMVKAVLEMTQVYHIQILPICDDLVISVENQFPLPEDEAEEKLMDLSEVSAQTMSRKRYIEKWSLLDSQQANEELRQIAYEQQLLNDSMVEEMGTEVGEALEE